MRPTASFRPMTPADFDAVVHLNADSVHFLSAMDAQRLAQLHAQAAWRDVAEIDGEVVAFLLGFREGSAYDSVNYRWFAQRCERFLYVDRVVVSAQHRSAGVASKLYERVFEEARNAALPWVTCEFDIDPPNPVSERFHAKFGFREVGRQRYGDPGKTVAMQAAPVA